MARASSVMVCGVLLASPHPTTLILTLHPPLRILASWPSQSRAPAAVYLVHCSHSLTPHLALCATHPRETPPSSQGQSCRADLAHCHLRPAGLRKGPSAPAAGALPGVLRPTARRGSLRGPAEGRTPRWAPRGARSSELPRAGQLEQADRKWNGLWLH